MTVRTYLALLAFVLFSATAHASHGYLVVAPDRGFLGNSETRDALASLADTAPPTRLVFITDERAWPYFRDAVKDLQSEHVDRIIILPFYLSEAHPDFKRLHAFVARTHGSVPIGFGRPFGRSYLAVRDLADRLDTAPEHAQTLLVAGNGAKTAAQADAMRADLKHLAQAAADRFSFSQVSTLVTRENDDPEKVLAKLKQGTVVLPFHLGAKYSGMMAYSTWLHQSAPKGIKVLVGGVTPHPAVGMWLQREMARYQDIPKKRIGVVIHAHGADFHWNQSMRDAAAGLKDDYLVEYAFSMGDPVTLNRAIKRLEKRGAQALVIVRVFSMADSFLAGIERFIGTDYESCRLPSMASHGHHRHRIPRLLSPLPVATEGGLEDDPLFARALLDRAHEISRDPEKETIILVGHGKGRDSENAAWLDNLSSLRKQMLTDGGDAFRAIRVATWREDWPDKRSAAIKTVRRYIEQANRDGGRALLIPERSTAKGPARDLIPDLDFEMGRGFAPHPLFEKWLREQVRKGIAEIRYQRTNSWQCHFADAAVSMQ